MDGVNAGASTVTVGEIVTESSGVWVANDSSNTSTPGIARGIVVVGATTGNPASVMTRGVLYWTGLSGFSAGVDIYSGASGAVSSAATVGAFGAGANIQKIGWCYSANVGEFDFVKPTILAHS